MNIINFNIDLFKDILLIFSSFVGIIVALIGLFIWKKQVKWKTKYDIAKNLLEKVYKVRSYMQKDFRNIVIEYTLPKGNITKYELYKNVYNERGARLNDVYNEMVLALFSAKVVFGKRIREIMAPFHKCYSKLINTTKLYFAYLEKQEKIPDKEKERIDKIMQYISDNAEEDPFSGEVNDSVESIEKFLKPYLKI